uniref:Uncharacterized protein n=1 Tax=Anguilla anguilla TaxID=7936 RepID=A0A0E9THI1_ANGAN
MALLLCIVNVPCLLLLIFRRAREHLFFLYLYDLKSVFVTVDLKYYDILLLY